MDNEEEAKPVAVPVAVEPLLEHEIKELRVFIESRKRWRWLRKTAKSFFISSVAIVTGLIAFNSFADIVAKRFGDWFK